MFEDFRNQIDDDAFGKDDQPDTSMAGTTHPSYFLGMTPVQRFIIAVLLFLMTLILGLLFLLVTSKIVPPFLG